MQKIAMIGIVAALVVSAGTTQAREKIIHQLGWTPGGDNGIEYYALHKGFFADEGLDVTIVSGNGSADALTKVAAGVAQIGGVGLETLFSAQAKTRLPVKAIYTTYTKKPDSIHVPADSPIKTLSDLKGKQVGIGSFSASNVVWPLVAKMNGLDPATVNLIKTDAASLAPMLASGRVDAIINWVTVAPLDVAVMKKAGKDMRIIPWSNFGYEGYAGGIVANEEFLKNKPEVVKAYLRAYVKAARIVIKDPQAAGDAVRAIVPQVDAAIAAAQFEACIPLLWNEITQAEGFGNFDPARIRTTWKWVAESQNLALDSLDPMSVVETGVKPK